MKNILKALLVAALMTSPALAQNDKAAVAQAASVAEGHRLTIFTENGEPFWLVVNGVRQNTRPETNVKVTGLTQDMVQVKVILQDEKLGTVDWRQQLEGVDPGYNNIVLRIAKSPKAKMKGRYDWFTVSWESQTKSPETPVARQDPNQYAVPFHTSENWTVTMPAIPMPVVNTTINADGSSTTEISSVTGTTRIATPAGSANAPADPATPTYSNGNRPAPGRNSKAAAVERPKPAPVTPGKPAPVPAPAPAPAPCKTAMAPDAFQKQLARVEATGIASDRLKAAKAVVRNNCLSVEQVKTLVSAIKFDSDQVDLAKYAYTRCVDRANYDEVTDVLKFSSSKDEVRDFIEAQGN